MHKNMLKSKMILQGDTSHKLATLIGISQQRFSAKLNEWKGAQFTQQEIKQIKDRYNLTGEEIDLIFFTETVS